MKKAFVWCNIIIITITLLCSSSNIYADDNSIQELRVGLRQLYEKKELITVNNKVLNMGYVVQDEYISEQVFMSNNGFVFRATTSDYLISINNFDTYEKANERVRALKGQGYKAYVGNTSKGIWKIYIQAKNNNEARILLSKLNGKDGLTYEKVADNGCRTIMELSAGECLVIENTNQYPQFSSMSNDEDTNFIDLGERQYRGRLEFGRYDESGITAINIVPMNCYLYSVLASEMLPYWPIEALKAQALAARNYAVYYTQKNSKYPNKPYTLCDTTSSQAYKGCSVEHANTVTAVNKTANKLIYYQGEVIQATFFSTSGGHTENSENVWNGTVPFLKGVPDIYEVQPARKPWITQLTSDEIKKRLAKYNIDVGDVTDVIPMGYTEGKRVINLKIVGTKGEYIIKKETIRSWLGLYSRKFTIVKEGYSNKKMFNVMSAGSFVKVKNINNMYVSTGSNSSKKLSVNDEQLIILSGYNIDSIPTISGKKDTYIFVGQGWGHGVGMSQSGAKGMALEGFTYDEILKYYYKGVDIK
ncbi:SpoIID/LytB domain-containing protein [Vallitalea sp.]|jgi:stage II sporulation protein D|uniref:SpoIID/LytB domain-containing protein n=1 Tax=Vallitalea sp. TaxID=1882829 RepID=UPI0025D3A3C8|nr:SpoIID/LytB domain-containing protein [Vallitalea sp.]MCT4685960.1 SpoIID/LytB domain-containing protein [Vallitalea sp.]